MLKKNSTKVLAFALAFAMIGGSLSPAVVSTAKKKTKNLQGCTKKVTVKVGKTKKIKVKGIVKSKKFTVKNKKIAKVSKKGTVKGLKTGKTSIKVKVKFWQNGKVKKKNYKVSVIVKGNKKTTKKTVVNNTSTTITNNSSTTNTSNTNGSEEKDKATAIPATATPTAAVDSSMSFKKDGFEVKGGTLVGVPKDEKEIMVPEGTKKIGSYVFQNTKAETVIITNTVMIIQNNAFYGAENLKEVDIPDSVTKIGDNAFEGCKNLVTIKISGKDVEIGTNVVKGCISLNSTLPTTKTCDHAYSEKIEKEPTCTEEGTKVSVCNNCGQRLVKKIAKKKHDFSKKDTSYLKESANCGSPAVYYVSCSVCGKKGTDTFTSGEKDLSNHVGEVVKGGTKDAHEKCSTCGAILNDDHDMKEVEKVPATCTGSGVMAYVCDCGYSYEKEIPKLNHSFDEGIVATPAACETTGTKVYTCTVCGTTKTEVIPATGHDFDTNFTIDRAATTELPGEKSRHCKNCDARTDICEVSMLEKVYNDPEYTWKGVSTCSAISVCVNDENATKRETVSVRSYVESPATCTGPGVTVYVAEFSDSAFKTQIKKVEIPKLSHDYKMTITTPATCETDGVKTFTCKYCNDTKTEAIKATGHVPELDYTVDRAATCKTDGQQSIHCSVCGNSIENTIMVIPATGHTKVSCDNGIPATCETEGKESDTKCSVCGEILTTGKVIDALGHTYDNGVITTEPTCTTTGTKTYTCTVCNAIKTETLNALGHEYEEEYTIDKKATCTEAGTKSKHCKRYDSCGAKTDEQVINATNHSFGDWEAVGEATCETGGTMQRKCSVCGEIETKEIPAAGHVSSNTKTYVKTAATCTEDAIYYKECSICHKQLTGEWTDEGSATGHNYAEPTFAWTEDGSSCKATYNCSVCGNRKIVDCQIKQTITKEPTCTEAGDTTYTATAINPVTKEESTNTKKVTGNISAVGHNYGEPIYTWQDGSSGTTYCKAIMHCETCNHSETETIAAVKKTTAATCTKDGSKVFTATFKNSAFTKQTKTVVLSAKGHSYGNVTYTWSDDKLTCTAKRVCANDASHVETETANAVVTVIREPTCTTTGSKTYTVTFKNEAFDSKWTTETIPALGHDYEGQPITYTFNKEGYVNGAHVNANEKCTATVKCKTCNQAKTETVYTTKTVKTPATCTKKGTVTYTAVFKDSAFETQTKDVEELAIVAHSYDDGVITKEPTCSTKGVKTYTCTLCGATKTEEVAATGHDYQNPTYTYSKGGYNANAGRHIAAYELCYATSVCTKCGLKSSTTVNTVSETIKASTCSEYGTRKVTAHFTKEPYTDQVVEVSDVAKLAHTYNDGVVTKEPTCTTGGIKTYTCTICGATKAEGINKLGHEYEEEYTVDKEATCTNSGTKSRHCKRYASCGSKTNVQVIPALGHSSKVELKDASSEIKKSNNLISVLACDLFLDDSKNYIGIDAEATYSHACWNWPDYIFYLEDDYVDDTYTIKAGYYKAMPIVSSNVAGDDYGFFVLGGKKDSTAPTYLGESYKVDTGTCIRCGHKHVYNSKVELKEASSNIQNTNKYFGEVCSSDFAKDSTALNNTDDNSALYLDIASGYSGYIVYLTESISVKNDYGTTITFDPGYYKLGTDNDGKYYFMDSRLKSNETTSLGTSYQVTNTEVCSSCGQKTN